MLGRYALFLAATASIFACGGELLRAPSPAEAEPEPGADEDTSRPRPEPSRGRGDAGAGDGAGGGADASPDSVRPPSKVPAVGSADTLDLASWNVEWFGAPDEGPRDDALQAAHVQSTVAGAAMDVWAFEEVVDGERLRRSVQGNPGWAVVVASDATVTGGRAAYGPDEQKLALAYDMATVRLVSVRVVLPEASFDFAGRPPVEARLEHTAPGKAPVAFTVLVVHMKAGDDAEAWTRRQGAALALKKHLDGVAGAEPVFVLGDWNDELERSKVKGRGSPFEALVTDAARYFFPSLRFEREGLSTMVGARFANDQHMVTKGAAGWYVAASAAPLRLDAYIDRYGETTSDHYPVVSRYRP